MSELHHWLNTVHQWYQHKTDEHVANLQPLILNAPAQIWGPNVDETQSKAIACWLDACLRQFEFY
ncbi:transcriptional regulator, partial [Vibrio cholerae]|nr:transcriptional regulator [Vibrio cholerae]